MSQVIEIDTSQMTRPNKVDGDLFSNRSAIAAMQRKAAEAEVSIIVVGYNRVEKTKRCVESILNYTADIDYELILIDSGSEDGTLEYFNRVPYGKKKIFHISQNLGAAYTYSCVSLNELGDFICIVQNDVIATANWMANLLLCIKSDPRIGMVNPVSSNISNLQCVNLPCGSYDEMQQAAREFNRTDAGKWEDRQRLITLGTLYRKEVFLAAGWPIGDMGFYHDFFDDDISFTIRHLGYRTILAGDTWVCHDHDLQHGEGKDPAEFQKSLETGRVNFRTKHLGVDAWDDVNNFYAPYLSYLPAVDREGPIRILGVDVKCGTPILDVKNWLRKNNMFHAELSAFTQDVKYWPDLRTICEGTVSCDREEFLTDPFLPGHFDYVVADRPLNRYHEPQKIVNDLFALCKEGGVVLCKLKNTYSFQQYLYLLGQWEVHDPEYAYHIPLEVFRAAIEQFGTVEHTVALPFPLNSEQQEILSTLLPAGLSPEKKAEVQGKMMCKEYLFIVKKKKSAASL